MEQFAAEAEELRHPEKNQTGAAAQWQHRTSKVVEAGLLGMPNLEGIENVEWIRYLRWPLEHLGIREEELKSSQIHKYKNVDISIDG